MNFNLSYIENWILDSGNKLVIFEWSCTIYMAVHIYQQMRERYWCPHCAIQSLLDLFEFLYPIPSHPLTLWTLPPFLPQTHSFSPNVPLPLWVHLSTFLAMLKPSAPDPSLFASFPIAPHLCSWPHCVQCSMCWPVMFLAPDLWLMRGKPYHEVHHKTPNPQSRAYSPFLFYVDLLHLPSSAPLTKSASEFLNLGSKWCDNSLFSLNSLSLNFCFSFLLITQWLEWICFC